MIAEGERRHGTGSPGGGIPNLTFVQADATALPFADGEFDTVTMSFGLRNVNDPKKALRELLRVTKPGGRLVICEFSHPPSRSFNGLYRFYNDRDPARRRQDRELERRRLRLPERIDPRLARPAHARRVDPRGRVDERRAPQPLDGHRGAAQGNQAGRGEVLCAQDRCAVRDVMLRARAGVTRPDPDRLDG